MGLIIDTGVFVFIERRKLSVDLEQMFSGEILGVSAITISELLVGVVRADTQARRDHRIMIVDSILASLPVHAFTLATARVHAPLHADLRHRAAVPGARDRQGHRRKTGRDRGERASVAGEDPLLGSVVGGELDLSGGASERERRVYLRLALDAERRHPA